MRTLVDVGFGLLLYLAVLVAADLARWAVRRLPDTRAFQGLLRWMRE